MPRVSRYCSVSQWERGIDFTLFYASYMNFTYILLYRMKYFEINNVKKIGHGFFKGKVLMP